MTENDWLTSTYSYPMLQHIEQHATPRQLRLFASGCCRLVWNQLEDESRIAVETADRFADSLATFQEMALAIERAPQGKKFGGSWVSHNAVQLKPRAQAQRTVLALATKSAFDAAWNAARESMTLAQIGQCDVLRDILPNPFCSLPDDKAMQCDSVRAVADEIYIGNDFDQMPRLAELLVAEGCENTAILKHCSSKECIHVRGCWLIDQIRAKVAR